MAHEGLWEQLLSLDPQATAERANCGYTVDGQRFTITMLNAEYVVELSAKRLLRTDADAAVAAGFIEQLCILAYLIGAKDIPLAGKLIKPELLPGGEFFFRGPHIVPTEKLEEAFGQSPDDMRRAGEPFGASRCEFGDASIELRLLPRVPITMVIWRGDDEFAARASILLDRTAGNQLPLDALLAGMDFAIGAVIKSAAKRS